jgi:hypothetical protein
VALGLVLRAVAPAEETRIAQAAGPASAEKLSDDDLRDLVEFPTTR